MDSITTVRWHLEEEMMIEAKKYLQRAHKRGAKAPDLPVEETQKGQTTTAKTKKSKKSKRSSKKVGKEAKKSKGGDAEDLKKKSPKKKSEPRTPVDKGNQEQAQERGSAELAKPPPEGGKKEDNEAHEI
nr:unnamed protein product [Haemonchus contortus]